MRWVRISIADGNVRVLMLSFSTQDLATVLDEIDKAVKEQDKTLKIEA